MIELPGLRPDQVAVVKHPAKVKVCVLGRRWGKTLTGGVVSVNVLRQHGRVAWVAPTFKNTRPMWRWATAVSRNERRLRIREGDKIISSSRGGSLSVFSADNADSILGDAFHLVIVDEAALVKEEVINNVIMPTLADYDGDLILIGTPRGKNYFYHMFMRGQSDEPGIASWQGPTSMNPIPSIQRAFKKARKQLPERTFRQEFLAQFIDDGGEVFRGVRACATAIHQAHAMHGHQYIIGVDWAKYEDFNVFAVFDINEQALVHLDRSQSIDYMVQCGRLKALADKFNNPVIVAETNSMGDAVMEQLMRMGLQVVPFTTTNATKAVIIDGLTLAFEQKTIRILNDTVLIGELEAYTMKRTGASRLLRYTAPDGMHDDTVIALALAYHGGRGVGSPDDWVLGPR